MAEEVKSNRRVKLTAQSKDTKIPKIIKTRDTKEPDLYKCCYCGKSYTKLTTNFPASQSELHAGLDYHLPICRKCLDILFEHYTVVYGGDEDLAIRRICEMFDIYYNVSLLNASRKITKSRSRIHTYISRWNLQQYKDRTYDTTLDEERNRKEEVIETLDDIEDKSKTKIKTVKFFGTGFTDEDYAYLQEQYIDWTTRHECKTKAQEEVFKRICFKQLEILKATRDGKDTKDLDKTYQDLLSTAKLQPKQTDTDALSKDRTFGQLIKIWEDEKPIPEPEEEFKDVDGIARYLSVYFLGHLAKMVGIKNRFSRMYEEEMKKYTVEKPEYEEDTEALFDAIFGGHMSNNDTTENGDSYDQE